ncbi:hypothetical protein C815_00632 [Firmicutes bacterium M10-2]|nr:hypothetical protein C815_00632 [Firmicutes bacterium M10-2]
MTTTPEKNERIYELLLDLIQRLRRRWKDDMQLYPTFKAKDLEMLAFLYTADHPISMQELASFLKVSGAAASQSTAALEKRKIVQRTPSPKDHRINHISLHPELLARYENEKIEMKKTVERFQEYTNEEFDLERLLEKILEFAEQDNEKNPF